MSFELRKLEDVCDILDHMRIPITSRDRKAGPYPYYGANGIQDYIDDYIFDDELVLLAEDGGNFGSKEKPIAYRISGKTWVNNHAHVLKPKNIIDVDYLCYSLMYYDVSGLVNGATRQKLTQSEMRKINIRYRSLEKQRQIVFKIKLVSNIISSRKHQLCNLDLLVKSRFIEMFGNPKDNPKRFKSIRIGELTDVLTGSTPNRSNKDYYEGKIPWVKTGEIHPGYINSTEECISEVALKETTCKLLPVDTVMIAMYGQGKTRGQSGILGIKAATNQACAAILPCEKLNPVFLNHGLSRCLVILLLILRGGRQIKLKLFVLTSMVVVLLQNQKRNIGMEIFHGYHQRI